MRVIPFFERYSLHTQKRQDFELFRQVVEMMNQEMHLSSDGFARIVELAYAMNANGSRRKVPREDILGTLKSSETIRQRSAGPAVPA